MPAPSKIQVLGMFFLVAAAGCASIATLAPPVSEPMAMAAASRGTGRDVLERGRNLYIQDCARCHSPVAVRKLGSREWDRILPDMAIRTRLDQDALKDLQEYIGAVLGEP